MALLRVPVSDEYDQPPGELAERIGLQRLLAIGVCQLVGVAASVDGLFAIQHRGANDQRYSAGGGYAHHEQRELVGQPDQLCVSVGRLQFVGRELREHLWCYGELVHPGER